MSRKKSVGRRDVDTTGFTAEKYANIGVLHGYISILILGKQIEPLDMDIGNFWNLKWGFKKCYNNLECFKLTLKYQ